jgi:hypothetical protein
MKNADRNVQDEEDWGDEVGEIEIYHFEEEGDQIIGTYKGKEEEVGQHNSNLYHIETLNGLEAIWGSTVIDSRMSKVQIGNRVKIVYDGLKVGKNKATYKAFKIFQKEAPFEEVGETPSSSSKKNEISKAEIKKLAEEYQHIQAAITILDHGNFEINPAGIFDELLNMKNVSGKELKLYKQVLGV